MRKHHRWFVLTLGICLLMGGRQAHADLIQIQSTTGPSNLGSYTGSLDYAATSSTAAILTINLQNTTAPALGGYLTAFVFNNPNDKITSASLPTTAHFSLLSGSNSINASPYGSFDFGASTGGAFQGGGNPALGLAPGHSGTFTFTLAGTGMESLKAADFFKTLSVGPGQGQGSQAFVARFRGFIPNGSDKVPGIDPPNPGPGTHQLPEPGSLVLASLGGLGLIGVFRARRKRGSAQPG